MRGKKRGLSSRHEIKRTTSDETLFKQVKIWEHAGWTTENLKNVEEKGVETV